MRVVMLVAFGIIAACSSWQSVHDEAAAMVRDYGSCRAGDSCVLVNGREHDCTGVLGCGFAVRADHEFDANRRADDLANQSRGFNQCAQAFCAGPFVGAACDADAGRCVPIDRVVDAGSD